MFRDLSLHAVYDSEDHDLIRDVQVPLLSRAQEYLRGVGFFSSGWLRLASAGVVPLVEGGGRIRIVASPVFQEEDWEALRTGYAARYDQVLLSVLSRNISDLGQSLERHTLDVLAWMVADGVMEFRVAVPRSLDRMGYYHNKVAVFTDRNGDMVAIHGSLNDSVQASLNGEALSVFKSWEPAQAEYAKLHRDRLESLWSDKNKQFRVHRIPDSVLDAFISLRSSEVRPYRLPLGIISVAKQSRPSCNVQLYDFQKEAVDRWFDFGCRGIFEMATGTGKTFASLAAAVRAYEERGRLALVVLVPYLHLLEQWAKDCRDFGFDPILCSGDHAHWEIDVRSAVRDFELGVLSNVCIIAVHQTASTKRFATAISDLSANAMVIGDEVHGLGAPNLRNALANQIEMRLGLSATPRRWFDEEGTGVIYSYFGDTCYEYGLDKAIGRFLTPYDYHPVLVSLSDAEVRHYDELTAKIAPIADKAKDDSRIREQMKSLILQRARIVYSARAKLPRLVTLLQSVLSEHKDRGEEPRGILVFCAPGKHREVLRAISALGLRCHEFVHDIGLRERERLLKQFDEGELQALVAIRCLDEGVDVPSTTTAYIMASSTNPREFIQRRGRILRKAPGKDRAAIYDFIVVPPPERLELPTGADTSILKREMPRFAEFSLSAVNTFRARSQIRGILDRFGMLHLLEKRPWDVYHTLKGWDWSDDE